MSWRTGHYFLRLLVFVAALKSTFVLGHIVVTVDAYPELLNSRLPVFLAYILLNSGIGLWLVLASPQRSSLAYYFGVLFLFVASPYLNGAVVLLRLLPDQQPGWLPFFLFLQVESFAPYLFWKFAENFPGKTLTASSIRVSNRGRQIMLALGGWLFLVNFLPYFDFVEFPSSLVALFDRNSDPSMYWPLLFLLVFLSVAYLLSRIPGSNEVVKRRLFFLGLSLVIGITPMFLVTILRNIYPSVQAFVDANESVVFTTIDAYMLSIPITSAYSLLAHRVFDLKFILKFRFMYTLYSYLLVGFTAAPWIALASFFAWSTKGSPSVPGLVILLVACITGFSYNSLKANLNRRYKRDDFRLPQVVTEFPQKLIDAQNQSQILEVSQVFLKKHLHVKRVNIFLLDEGSAMYVDHRSASLALSRSSKLVEQLQIPINQQFTDDLIRLSSHSEVDKFWMLDNQFQLLSAIKTNGDKITGIIGFSGKSGNFSYTASEIELIEAVKAILLLRLGSIGNLNKTGETNAAGSAFECGECGIVQIVSGGCAYCGGLTEYSPLPDILSSTYKMERRIGRGAAGVVYLAMDLLLERKVAIKTLPALTVEEALVLKQEARTMAQLTHPNLAQVFGVEIWQGLPAMVLEFLPNESLAEKILNSECGDIQKITLELFNAIEAIHEAGIIHRDVKPANIGFGKLGEVKLMDFGLGKFLNDKTKTSIESLSEGLTISGTPRYLQPEAFFQQIDDESNDIWALAVVLHELQSGAHPFEGGSERNVMQNIINVELTGLQNIKVTQRPFFENCFARKKKDRPQTVSAMRALYVSMDS